MTCRIAIFMFLSIALAASLVTAQTGGTASPFALGAGSRDLSLGGADISTCDFGTAAYWNPSRLAQSEQYSIMGFHTRLYDADVAYQYIGLVIPTLDWGSLGIGVFRLGVDNIEKRDADNLLMGTVEDNRMGFRLAYGRTIGSVDFGLAASLETHSLDTYKATSSPGLDLAASKTMTTPFSWCDRVTLSIVGRNVIAPTMRLVDESIKSPLELQAGMSSRLILSHGGRQTLELFGGLTKPQVASPAAAVGAEYSMFDLLDLRASVRNEQLSFGAGVSFRGFSFDYALVNRDLGPVHMITLTSVFGTPTAERRELRAKRREEAFNRTMSTRLSQKNIELASQLMESGKTALSVGDLTAADADFDRALFLIRGSGADTSEYAALAATARAQLVAANHLAQLSAHVDSARVRLAAQDYLGCQYFAGLALAVDSNSVEAAALRSEAASATEELTRRQEFVQQRIWAIDSLIRYGAFAEALTAAHALNRVSADDPSVGLTLRKAEFESFKAQAETEFSRQEFTFSIRLLDSALIRFPGHNRCLGLRQQCRQALERTQAIAAAPAVAPPPLNRDIQKQAQNTYARAQSAFREGNLIQAIALWEEVNRLAPGYQSVHDYLVKAYRFVGVDLYSQNRLTEALANWEKALAIAPNNTEIAAYMRRTQNEINRLKELSYDN